MLKWGEAVILVIGWLIFGIVLFYIDSLPSPMNEDVLVDLKLWDDGDD